MKEERKYKIYAKPFVKWAGGKTQLLPEIAKAIPDEFCSQEFVYIEPFVGGGSVLFYLLREFPNIKQAVINDINSDLINVYSVIQSNVNELIGILKKIEKEYHALDSNTEKKKEYYYSKRFAFNRRNENEIMQAALFIFLNRTCFNGLYRVNKKNEFNVPWGSYKKPMICDEDNLQAVNKALQNVIILNSDFEKTLEHAEKNTLFYLDPPYKPLSKTSSFTSYTKDDFTDDDQIRLARFCERLDEKGYKWILNNSDLQGKNPEDNFFETLYNKFNISRVLARRNINANPQKRGELTELLITNIT